MAVSPAFTLTPARVHERARSLTGHHPAWIRRAHRGGLYSIEHYRVCSWCSCIHPADMIELLRAGGSTLEPTTKDRKFLLLTPNPAAGELVQMGTRPGPVFSKDHDPADLLSQLLLATRTDLPFPVTIGERLTGHFDRAIFEPAPELIRQPFYSEHTTEPQWAEIEAAAQSGEHHEPLPGPEARDRNSLPQRQ